MIRTIKSACSVIESSNEFVMELRQTDIPLIALELSMLMIDVIEKLNFIFHSGSNLQFVLDKKLTPGEKAHVNVKNSSLEFYLSFTHLEYICAVLLRAYRDQIAEINHIHIEGKKENIDFDFTLLFENSVEPLAPDEANLLIR